MEIALPVRVDAAAHRFTNFRQQLDASRPGMPAAEFSDGSGAPHATHVRYGGSIVVSHPLIGKLTWSDAIAQWDEAA